MIPWAIDGFPVVLHDWDSSISIEDISFSVQPFWIQIKELPLEFLIPEIIKDMGSSMGEVVEIDPTDGNPPRGSTVRALVNISVMEPLRRGILLISVVWTRKWIKFFYKSQPKKLWKCCYVIDHKDDVCEKIAEEIQVNASKLSLVEKQMSQRSHLILSHLLIYNTTSKGETLQSPSYCS